MSSKYVVRRENKNTGFKVELHIPESTNDKPLNELKSQLITEHLKNKGLT